MRVSSGIRACVPTRAHSRSHPRIVRARRLQHRAFPHMLRMNIPNELLMSEPLNAHLLASSATRTAASTVKPKRQPLAFSELWILGDWSDRRCQSTVVPTCYITSTHIRPYIRWKRTLPLSLLREVSHEMDGPIHRSWESFSTEYGRAIVTRISLSLYLHVIVTCVYRK